MYSCTYDNVNSLRLFICLSDTTKKYISVENKDIYMVFSCELFEVLLFSEAMRHIRMNVEKSFKIL